MAFFVVMENIHENQVEATLSYQPGAETSSISDESDSEQGSVLFSSEEEFTVLTVFKHFYSVKVIVKPLFLCIDILWREKYYIGYVTKQFNLWGFTIYTCVFLSETLAQESFYRTNFSTKISNLCIKILDVYILTSTTI